MPLSRVTLTGVDEKTSPEELLKLSARYPFAEWGVLFSPKRQGEEPRYPPKWWLEQLYEVVVLKGVKGYSFAAHLCGKHTRDVVQYGNLNWVHPIFERVQLNGVSAYSTLMENMRWPASGLEVILQIGKKASLEEVAKFYRMLPFMDLAGLWDPSGGKGIRTKKFPDAPTLPRGPNETVTLRIGYAGGISPENIEEVLGALKDKQHVYWIDMETGVRTDDWFDVEKVEEVLQKAEPFVDSRFRRSA
jgi:hypothetical protein